MNSTPKTLLFASVTLTIGSLPAADILWSGVGDGINWLDDANWTGGSAPESGDNFNPQGATIQVNGPGATYSTLVAPSSGSVVINDGGTLTGGGANFRVIRYVDFTVNNGGEFHVPFDADIRRSVTINAGGVFSGGDEVKDSAILTISGEWSPGDSVDGGNAIIANNGDYVLTSTGTLYLDLYGNGVNEHFETTSAGADIVLNAGNIVLNAQGYTPQLGDQFDLWDNTAGGTITPGGGSNITLSGFTLDVSTFATDGIVSVVPEPQAYATMLALAVGLGVLWRRRAGA